MCNQAVGLIAAEIERRGIPTVCLVLLREIAEKVRPPRTLVVPFAHGYPLGEPLQQTLQCRVLEKALELLEREATPPLIVDFED